MVWCGSEVLVTFHFLASSCDVQFSAGRCCAGRCCGSHSVHESSVMRFGVVLYSAV